MVADAEAVLAPVAAVAKTYTVHNVGHAHIDMNWMWPWPETVAVTNDTFTTVLRLMDEFPDFRFTQSQASVYEIARRYTPALFERIKARVAEGRWEVVASQWVEGDKNHVSGESIARHLLYTRRFMQGELGLKPEDIPIDWSPDTFGHARTIPTLVSRGGVTRYYICRGGRDEKPPVFWWRGPDGSRILVNLETTWYLKAVGPENAQALVAFAEMTRLAAAFNHPLQVVSTDVHSGRLSPAAPGLATVSPAEVVVGAVKKAERDGSIVFRLVETAGKACTARLELSSLLGRATAAEEVDFLERPLTTGTARLASGAVTVDVPAQGVASVRLRF